MPMMKTSKNIIMNKISIIIIGTFLVSFLPRLSAQAQFAGTYFGTFNTKVSAGSFSTELPAGVYLAVVSASGAIDLNSGVLVGTVSASGAVTFTGSAQGLATFGIRAAQISNNQLSSAYGDVLGNGTTQFRLNPSTSFQGGGGTGGGGTGGGGGGTGGGGGGTGGGGSSSGNDLLAYYSFNNASNLLADDSGRGVTLSPVNGTVSQTPGRAGGALLTNGVRLRALVNSSFSTRAMTLAFFVRPDGAGNWNPRLVAVGIPGQSAHYYGTFLNGTSSSRTLGFLGNYLISTPIASTGALANGTWRHVAVTFENKVLRYYIDGQLNREVAQGGDLTTFSSAMLMIAGSDNNLDLFQGALDEVRLYNRALAASEVQTLASGGAVGSAVSGSGLQAQIAAGVVAAPSNAVGYRSRVGQSFEMTVTGAAAGGVWGTDVYTDDSSVARAAVHAGLVQVGETKTVTVTILPGQANYAASTRNGVTTNAYGSWVGSYTFAGITGTITSGGGAAAAPVLVSGFTAPALSIIPGGRLVLPITVSGVGPFTYQWFLNGVALANSNVNPYIVPAVTAAAAGTYTVRVSNAAGAQTFTAGTVSVPVSAAAPQIALHPFDKTVSPGGTFALAASAVGNGLSYQWLKDGAALPGETGSILLRQNVNAADAGRYALRIANSAGTVTTNAATVVLDPEASTISNLSGRLNVSGSATIIPGFTISGSGRKRVLVRAVGPTLSTFGLTGVMPDPQLEVYRGSTKVGENNDWNASLAPIFTGTGAFALQAGSKDAALALELDANAAYTVHVKSANGQGGIMLFEVYDAGNTSGASKFTNVSLRGVAGEGGDTLIAGLTLSGRGKRTLLLRGIGPQLAQYGVSAIADPQLNVYDSRDRLILSNNDWSAADFVPEMLQAVDYSRAFPLSGGSADASTLSLLEAGTYTMHIVAGSGQARDEALIEIYEIP